MVECLGSNKHTVPLGRAGCEHFDPRFKILQTPEKNKNNLLLQQQLSFDNGHIVFKRAFKPQLKVLSPLLKESQIQTIQIANKLAEFDFKFEKKI